jgi:hypothetical protein
MEHCLNEMKAHTQNLGAEQMPRRRRRAGVVPDRPAAEAETLVRLVRRGVDSPERLRELIAISATDEAELRKLFHPNLVRHHLRYRARVLHFFDAELANPHAAPRSQRRTGRFCPEMAGATSASTMDKSCFLRVTVPAKCETGPK